MTTTTIVRSGFPLKKSSLLIAGNCSRVFYCCIVSGEQYACIQFFKCLPHKESWFSKAEFTQSVVEVLIFNVECDDDNDVGYQTPITCGPRDLPHGTHFYRMKNMLPAHWLCRHDKFRGTWDGAAFPEIKMMYSKMKCKSSNFEMRTFCFCNWSRPMCVQCHGKHLAEIAFQSENNSSMN